MKKFLKWVCIILLIIFLCFVAWVWGTAESNDFDRPFINDGKDNDLKVVSNTDSLHIYPDTNICYKASITPAAFYYSFGLKHWQFYLPSAKSIYKNRYYHPYYLDEPSVLPIRISQYVDVNVSAAHKWSLGICKTKINNNLHVYMRIVLVSAPDTFGVWLRVRRGEEYVTIFREFRSSASDLGSAYPSVFDSEIAMDLAKEIIKSGNDMQQKITIDPSIVKTLEGERLRRRLAGYSVDWLQEYYQKHGDEEIKKEIKFRKEHILRTGEDY